MHIIHFKLLNEDQNREVLEWLREKNADTPRMRRTFSDVYPFAMLLLDDFPRQIDLVNYPKRSRIALKADNWSAFSFKFLSRHNLSLGRDLIEDLSKGTQGAIEILIYELIRLRKQQLRKIAKQQARISAFQGTDPDQDEDDDAEELNEEQHHNQAMPMELDLDNIVQVTSRMILFTRYEEISRECQAKDNMIEMYECRVKHLEGVCKSLQDELNGLSKIIKTLPEAYQQLFKPGNRRTQSPAAARGPQ